MKWSVEELPECPSTFEVARQRPAWTVVRADRQTAGRGRFHRVWYADSGGLWASYNLPLESASGRNWGLLPLVAGVSVMEALREYVIEGLRLRWPNDVLVGRAKLVGILVERSRPDMASVGIGINVSNDVVHLYGRTQDPPVRLADLVSCCPTPAQFSRTIARSLAQHYLAFVESGMEALVEKLMAAWGERKPVVAVTDQARHCGWFEGVDSEGSPVLSMPDGARFVVPGTEVLCLRELI